MEEHNHPVLLLTAPATLDGGDCLYLGHNELLVGLSERTNEQAISQIQALSASTIVHGVPFDASLALHLKSLISLIDDRLILIYQGAQELLLYLTRLLPHHAFLQVPDLICSNCLRIQDVVFTQKGFPLSESIIRGVCEERGLRLECLDMSEMVKSK